MCEFVKRKHPVSSPVIFSNGVHNTTHMFKSAYNKYKYILVYINIHIEVNIYVNRNMDKEAAISSGSQITVHSYGIGGE